MLGQDCKNNAWAGFLLAVNSYRKSDLLALSPFQKSIVIFTNGADNSLAWSRRNNIGAKPMPPYPKPQSQAQRAAMHAAAQGKSTLDIPKKVGAEFAKGDKPGKLPQHKPPPKRK
jgi:hypothetical protein